MWVLPLGDFAVPASSSVEPSVDGQESARRVLLGFVSGGCRSSNTAGEFSLNFVVLLLFCERVGDLGIPAGLSVRVAVSGNPGLLFRSLVFPSVAADLWSSFSWRSDGRCAITEIEASRRVPGVGSCGLTKAWSPSFREEEDLLELRRLSVELAREDDDEKLLEAVRAL
ncbi:hypothetical protein SEVIR_3G204100v4 [Setaria viridis]|uniref:Uncharacterized protein n=1 Tax=Setaria viridis TaxID=4556 RepID=A0A4U6VGZ4_SETVI|nr:hypothetical protein SEVIR_3G204100v2 [Setaria viridis]